MYLKLTENGGSRVIEVTECYFSRAPGPHVKYKKVGEAEEYAELIGDAFIIDSGGVTIEKFFIHPKRSIEGMNK